MLKSTPQWLKKSVFIAQAILAGLGIAFLWILITGRGMPNSSSNGQHFNPVASFADAVERAQPAVVSIQTAKRINQRPSIRSWPSNRRYQKGLGSGVIIREDGLILTNFHVIKDVEGILVTLPNGENAPAGVIGVDEDTDLALLQINNGGVKVTLPTLQFADSEDQHIGDVVLAIGNPYGNGQTVTQGIISATGRANIDLATFEDFIQTDATISEGNSGGALINTDGELIGINTAVSKQSGLAFAIPAKLAKGVVEEILENGRVIRGWIGISSQDFVINGEIINPKIKGSIVGNVDPSGPAAIAGIQSRDIITSINDIGIESDLEYRYTIASLKPGDTVKLGVIRGDNLYQVETQVQERPSNRS